MVDENRSSTGVASGPELTDDWWVSPLNFIEEVRAEWAMPHHVELHDVTLREAEQGRPIIFSVDQRVSLAEKLAEAGIKRLELMPEVSEGHLTSLRRIVAAELPLDVYALCRMDRTAIDQAIDAGATGINLLNASVNPWIVEHVVGWKLEQLLERVVEMAQYVRAQGVKAVVGSGDAFRTPPKFLREYLVKAVEEGGASGVKVNDSFGFAVPEAVTWLVRQVREWIGDTPIQIHVHNDFGLSLASALSAVTAGAEVVDVALNGYGERGGNTPLDEAAVGIEALLGLKTSVDLSRLYSLTRIASDMTGVPVPLNKPITGENLHTLWTGLHANWRMKATAAGRPQAWSPFSPTVVGKPDYQIILGPMSGIRSVQHYMAARGIDLSDAEAAEIRDSIKTEGFRRLAPMTDKELMDLASAVCSR